MKNYKIGVDFGGCFACHLAEMTAFSWKGRNLWSICKCTPVVYFTRWRDCRINKGVVVR